MLSRRLTSLNEVVRKLLQGSPSPYQDFAQSAAPLVRNFYTGVPMSQWRLRAQANRTDSCGGLQFDGGLQPRQQYKAPHIVIDVLSAPTHRDCIWLSRPTAATDNRYELCLTFVALVVSKMPNSIECFRAWSSKLFTNGRFLEVGSPAACWIIVPRSCRRWRGSSQHRRRCSA